MEIPKQNYKSNEKIPYSPGPQPKILRDQKSANKQDYEVAESELLLDEARLGFSIDLRQLIKDHGTDIIAKRQIRTIIN